MRVVIDTSTIIRGLTRRYSEPAYIVDQVKIGNLILVMSNEMALELIIAIYNMCRQNNISDSRTKNYLRAVTSFVYASERVEPKTNFSSCSDPDDAMFIECAIDAKVPVCISSDPSIFRIKDYCKNPGDLKLIQNIKFFRPQDFYNYITTDASI